jgi:flagellar biogenesis protein FliO
MAFFGGMPFPVQFILAFLIVLGLIGATAWMVRRFGPGRLGGGALRGRQPRLAVVDYASVDGRRRLILVRRDNVEHLVMIGGPSDVVVEANIVRAAAGVATRAPAAVETLPRAIPMPGGAAANGLANAPANAAWPTQPEAPSRTQRDTFAALADELSTPRSRPQANPRPQPAVRPEARQETRQENRRQEARLDSRQEPRLSPPQPAAEGSPSTDQALAEMAQQLEAALRKPVAKADKNEAREPRPAAMPRPVARVEPVTPAEAAAASPPAAPQPAMPLSAPRPMRTNVAESSKPLYDSLEQEMASLLGRSSAKN